MDEVLMRFGVVGFCVDCGDDRLLVPADDHGFEMCCTGCDGAVSVIQLSAALHEEGPSEKLSVRRAG